jgi:nicotinamidase-related amidase
LAELQPRPGELVVNKTAGAFSSSPLDALLRERGIQQLAIVGVGTNYCVESTRRGAADHGYDCVLVEDACGAILPSIHERAVQSMSPFRKVSTVGEVVGLFTR